LSPVGVTLKINHLQQCRWLIRFSAGTQFTHNFAHFKDVDPQQTCSAAAPKPAQNCVR